MKIKFEEGNLTISRKSKIENINSITVEQLKDGKFSISYHGQNGKVYSRYTIKVNNVSFSGLEFGIKSRDHMKRNFKNWKDQKTGKYINYYTLIKSK